jgi:mono/diheme cytochrome c family protein
VLQSGLSGTAMPSFALLSDHERAALVAYVKTFRTEAESPGTRIAVPQDPFAGDARAGARAGEKAYHGFARCWSCHPAYTTRAEMAGYHAEAGLPPPEFRPDLYRGETKDSTWGAPIRAPDFLTDRVKTGIAVDNLARVIGAGVGGTAMPTWSGALTPRQLWGLAYYVRDLSLLRDTPEADALRARLANQKEATP